MPSLLWEVITGVPANARRCRAVPFNTAPALECFRELSTGHRHGRLVCCRYTTDALAIVGHGEIYAKARAAISARQE